MIRSLQSWLTRAQNPTVSSKRQFRSRLQLSTLEDRIAPAAPAVALVFSDYMSYGQDVQTKLMSTGLFSTVDLYDVAPTPYGSGANPTLAQLENYQAIMVWTDFTPADATGLGNLMAQYDQAGFGVVNAMFSQSSNGFGLSGQWVTGKMDAFTQGADEYGPDLTLGAVAQPNHPVMVGPAGNVTSFDGNTYSFRAKANLNPGAQLIASWSNNEPLVAEQTNFSGNIISLNMFPVSNDGIPGFGWITTTSGTQLLANSLFYATTPHLQAPVADAGGPYTMSIGGNLTLDASKSFDPNTPPLSLTYSWDINGDGTYGDATGVSPTLTWAQLSALGIKLGKNSNVSVEVTNSAGKVTDSNATTITVSDIPPSKPTDINPATNLVLDNVSNGATVGITANSTNLNGEKITYSLTNNAGGRYTINANTGVVTVANAAILNGPSVDTITVQATDAGGSSTANFTINEVHVAPGATLTYTGNKVYVPVTISLINPIDNPTELAAGLTYSFDTAYYQHPGTFVPTQTGPANSTLVTFTAFGTYQVAAQVSDNDGASSTVYTINVIINTSGNGGSVATHYITTAQASGGSSTVSLFSTTGKLLSQIIPPFAGTVHLAVGDVNGDGVEDIIVGSGVGIPAQVDVLDGTNGNLIATYAPYPSTYKGGVNITATDINGDGFADIIVSPAAGSPVEPIVVYNGLHSIWNPAPSTLYSFTPTGIGNSGWIVGEGKLYGGNVPYFVVAEQGSGGMVQVINGNTLKSVRTFSAFAGYTGSLSMAVGVTAKNGNANIVLGEASKTKTDSMVEVLNGQTLAKIWTFDVYPNFNAGVTLSSDVFGTDGITDILIAPNAGTQLAQKTAPPILVLKGSSLAGVLVFNPYMPIYSGQSNYTGGIFVG